MSAELIVGALLNVNGVTALVGNRRAVSQLKQGTAMPALFYESISKLPVLTIGMAFGPRKFMSRVQITALAADPAGVTQVLAATMYAMNFFSGTSANKRVDLVEFIEERGIQRDNDAGIWYGQQDFMIHWYE